MQGQWLQKQRSVIFTWSFSYGIILLVPMIIASVTYLLTVRVMENEIVNSNHYLLKQTQQQMDGLLNDTERLSQEIARDSWITDCFTWRGPAKAINPYRLYRLVQHLHDYQLLNPSISDFYIYFRNLDLVVSPNNFLDSKAFYQIYYSNSDIGYSRWHHLISTNFQGEFTPVTYKDDERKVIRTIAFAKSLPLLAPLVKGVDVSANLVIILDESRFMNDVHNISTFNQGTMLILDNDHNILAASHPGVKKQVIPSDMLKGLNRSEGVLHTRYAGRKAVVSFVTSQVLEWKYIAILPDRVFWEKADYIRNLTLLGLLVCVCIGGAIAWYSLKKNYNPMNQLIQSLEKSQGVNFDKTHDEYSFIAQAIGKVQADMEKQDTILAQQNKVLREHFLTRLLLGKPDGKIPLSESFVLHDIDFQSDAFAVMAFYIEDFAQCFEKGLPTSETAVMDYYKNVQAVIVKVVEELLGSQNTGYMTNVQDMLVCLVNLAKNATPREAETEIARVAGEAQRLLEDSMDILLMVSVSNIHRTLAGIPEAYSEALQTMEYKRILGMKEIVMYEDIRELPRGNYYYPLEKEQQLINYIKTGDFVNAKTVVGEIFKANSEKKILPPQLMKCLLSDIYSSMMKAVNGLNGSGMEQFPDELNLIDRLWGCDKICDMKQTLMDILKQFCRYAENASKIRSQSIDGMLVDEVREYIIKNYHDPNMAITTIAEQFDVHPVYLSRIFKEFVGEGMLDFINKIRIREAKRLIRENRSNLDEVASAVGYYSTRTFTRAFKKTEGITPGKYKSMEESD